MSEKLVYLREDVQAEPLVNQWYVCLPMIAPIPAALNVKRSHIKIMESYIESPEEHIILSKEKGLVGGPFINYPENRVEEVQELLDKTLSTQKNLMELGDAVLEFSRFF